MADTHLTGSGRTDFVNYSYDNQIALFSSSVDSIIGDLISPAYRSLYTDLTRIAQDFVLILDGNEYEFSTSGASASSSWYYLQTTEKYSGASWQSNINFTLKYTGDEERLWYDEDGYDVDGFNRSGYDVDGYDISGYDISGRDISGYDMSGYDMSGYDISGYDISGRDISGYDMSGYDMSGYDISGYDISGYDYSGYDISGYDISGYDYSGYDISGYDISGRDISGYDMSGYDMSGYDISGRDISGYDMSGYDISGYDISGYDYSGYDMSGYDISGRDISGYDMSGYDISGYDISGRDISGYDMSGYDISGYDMSGYDMSGYDISGRDISGYDMSGYDMSGYDISGYDYSGRDISGYDMSGYDISGRDISGYDMSGYDMSGYDISGYDISGRDISGYDMSGYDISGRDISGYDMSGYDISGRDISGYDMSGYDISGRDISGYDYSGYDISGYDISGYDISGRDISGYDMSGYDVDGYNSGHFNASGFDSSGYDRSGYDISGYDISGYDISGYDISGYNVSGYNTSGYDISGYNTSGYDISGYDISGYDMSGYDAWGYNSSGFNADGEEQSTGAEFNYQILDGNGDVLDKLAVLGETIGDDIYGGADYTSEYRLDITAESLGNGYSLETADITIEFDADTFEDIVASDIQIGSAFNVANAVEIDNTAGTIRIAAGSLGDLDQGESIKGTTSLASIALNFDETSLTTINGATEENDGILSANPLKFTITANDQETVFSKDLDDGTSYDNRTIHTLAETGGDIEVIGQDVTLYQEMQRLEEQGEGLIISSVRTIGSATTIETNLIRSGDTVSAETSWLNTGNTDTNNITISGYSNTYAELVKGSFYLNETYESVDTTDLQSGTFVDGTFDSSIREEATLVADIKVTGEAGKVVDLSDGILSLQATNSDVFTNALGSKNLITYQGDLNYDGRVSMKDLAYLNAGAARQELDENNAVIADSVAADVDADFSGKIDIADLAILDADWGKTLHTGDETFTGSDSINWTELGTQGEDGSWNNSAFTDQNAVELALGNLNQTLDPAIEGVSGADDINQNQTNDLLGTDFQDAPAPLI